MKEPWEKELDKHDGDRDDRVRHLLTEAQNSLIAASIGSCTCLTKSPELAYHAADCRYLKIANAMEVLESLQKIASHRS